MSSRPLSATNFRRLIRWLNPSLSQILVQLTALATGDLENHVRCDRRPQLISG
jgi:predicted component of type VI protein secretion system